MSQSRGGIARTGRPSRGRLLAACVVALVIAVAGVPLSALPLPRADLEVAPCLGTSVPGAMWVFVLGLAVASLTIATFLARWSIPDVIRGRSGVRIGLIAGLAMAATIWNALGIATLAYDCGAPMPIADPLIALVPTVLATGMTALGDARPDEQGAGRGLLPSITTGLLVAGPIVLVLSAGWGLYHGPDAARFSLKVSGVSVVVGLAVALLAAAADPHRGKSR